MSWQKKLAELGLTEKELPIKLKGWINEYKTLQDGVKEAKAELENAISDEQEEELKDDLANMSEAIETLNTSLIKSIEKYATNKKAKEQPKAEEKPQEQPQPTPQPQETPKEKSGSGIGWIVGAVVVGAITLGAVNLFKRK